MLAKPVEALYHEGMKQTGKALLAFALQNGWREDRIKGSHHMLVKGDKLIVIPVHGSKDMPKGLFLKLKKEIEG